ncbi:MAG: hypothetical protein A2X52_14485 [Candidatus Rokubacteria bacterium GWC2_70_16]|nr:MAG: hypothetical protein A2X52_14485 [Candidatus Rokubacteria bacterium GWC2_70_16]
MGFQNIVVEHDERRALLTLNRPEKMNPLDWSTVKELRTAVAAIEADPAVRVVIVTGAGRAFSAGGDLEGYLTLYREPDRFRAFLDDFFLLLEAIEHSPRIYLAAVNGFCVAGGLEVMLACDLAIAAETARIGDGHLTFGQLPGAGGSQRLPRAIGAMRARYLMLTGNLVDGREAERIGLVAEAVPDERLRARADELVRELLAKSPAGLRGVKYLVNRGLEGSLASGLALELAYVHNYATTEADATEGLVAFKEKRPPRFS